MRGKLERREQVIVKMVCKGITAEVAATINELFDDVHVEWGPEIDANFSFDFTIEYWNVFRHLEQIEALLDTGKVEMVSTKELIHSKCLAQDLFCKIEKLEKKLKED